MTKAAGWELLGCHPNALAQDIRVVCRTNDDAGCNHMFDYGGPQDKMVRLPETQFEDADATLQAYHSHESPNESPY